MSNESHRLDCEEQPEGFPCICDHLAEIEYQEMIDAQISEVFI